MNDNMNFYYFALCHVCKIASPDLKKCSNCKVPYYCSRRHQAKDWPKHKTICKAIAKTNTIRVFPSNCSADDFNNFKYTSSLLWRYEIGRELDTVEQQMWMFPKVCSVCFSREAEIVCQKCLSVAYCSEEHQNSHRGSHEDVCPSLKLCILIQQTLNDEQILVDWLNFKLPKEVKSLPDSLEEVIKLMGFTNPANFTKRHVDYIVMTEYFAPAVNMLYALGKSGFLNGRRAKKASFCVHIVGSDRTEDQISWVLVIEFLSHWIINLKAMKIILIGPEIKETQAVGINLRCQECRAKNFAGTIIRIRGLYHDQVDLIARPDLVVAFNSGLHEFIDNEKDTWKKSIPKLIGTKGIPAILTAYTEKELNGDLARFQESRVNYLVKPRRNPYSSLRPNRNWEEGSEPIFYQSGYVAVITKK